MDHVLAFWTRIVVFQMLDDAGLAECVEAFGDCRGVDQVAMTDLASDHFIELAKLTSQIKGISHFGFFNFMMSSYSESKCKLLIILHL